MIIQRVRSSVHSIRSILGSPPGKLILTSVVPLCDPFGV